MRRTDVWPFTTPWHIDFNPEQGPSIWIVDATGRSTAKFEPWDDSGAEPVVERVTEMDHADAAFIVTACNAHDELVAALRGMLELAECLNSKRVQTYKAPCVVTARAALAKATP